MSIYSSNSSSGYSTVTEATSPPVSIRRPLDLPILPRDSLSPNPPPLPITPVIITPVERRSTRELVERIRPRRRHVLLSRNILTSIRRRLSLATAKELRKSQKKVPKTSEGSEDFDQELLEELQASEDFGNLSFPVIPSESGTRAWIREQNRLEALETAVETLEMGPNACLADIQDTLAVLDSNLRLMDVENDMIDQILEDYEREKCEMDARWMKIEKILELFKE